ncbi:MAG: hypothetical protein HFH14_04985 [Lachnospiraceae bacterium]|nr:hypothetical protein [Lachnospiraceae bacterium]
MKGRILRINKKIISIMVIGALLAGLTCHAPRHVSAGGQFSAVYNVTAKEFGAKRGKDSTAAIQKALDKAAKKGTSKKQAQVYIPSGTYYITKTLSINSNTYLKCDKKTKIIKKNKKALYMLRTAKNGKKGKKGYNNVKNVTVDGGTWDARFLKYNKETGGSLFFFVHSRNLTFTNLTLRNNYGTHLLELGGDRDVQIKGCTFYGFKKSSNNDDKEAIQLDVCHNYKILPDGMPYDDTPCMNVTIEDNEIYGYPRAIGSHSLVKGIYPSNITIAGNNIHDISQNAVYAYNYRNLKVTGNTFDKVYAGVVFKSYATEGKQTIFNRNKGVKAMSLPEGKYNLEITDNVINTTKYDVGKETMQLGVFVYGTDQYVIDGVNISNNTINSASTGIYMRYAGKGTVSGNTCTRNNNSSGGKFLVDAYKFLSCNDLDVLNNSVKGNGNLFDNGMALRGNSRNIKLTGNTIEWAGKHGIGVYEGSVAVITGNSIRASGQHGITVMDQSSANMDGNSILSSVVNGITVLGSDAAINNNTVSGSGQTGISVQNQSSISALTNNTITGNTGKAIALNASSAPDVRGNTIEIQGGSAVTVVGGTCNISSVRGVTVSEISAGQESITGTIQLEAPVYALIDGIRYDAVMSKKSYSIKIPKQPYGKTVTVMQEDAYGNKYTNTKTVR